MRSIAPQVVALFLVFVAGAAPGNAEEAPQVKLESQGGGLQTATFNTFTGTVTVNLPEDIVAGDTFSGTVVAEPEGDSDKKKGKNLAALAGYVFELGEHQRGKVGDGRLKLDVPAAREGSAAPSTATLILREVRNGKPGREIGRVEIPVRETAPEMPDFRLPTLAQQNVPLRVSGPLQTLTVVRHRSRNQSIDNSIPMPSKGRPTDWSTMIRVTKPASGMPAAPIAASVAVMNIIICWVKLSSIPNI